VATVAPTINRASVAEVARGVATVTPAATPASGTDASGQDTPTTPMAHASPSA
jgi:hypothetical protein